MEAIKILLVTHSAVLYTGMAEVTRLLFRSLMRRYPGRYEVHQLGLFHTSAMSSPDWSIHSTDTQILENGKVVLNQQDLAGQRSFPRLAEAVKPEVVFAFNDPYNLEFLCAYYPLRTWKLVLYANFDGVPVPPDVKCLLGADRIVTMSEFSKRAFLDAVGHNHADKVSVVYAPADTDRFRPLVEDEKGMLRRANLPDWDASEFVHPWVGGEKSMA